MHHFHAQHKTVLFLIFFCWENYVLPLKPLIFFYFGGTLGALVNRKLYAYLGSYQRYENITPCKAPFLKPSAGEKLQNIKMRFYFQLLGVHLEFTT